MSDFTITINGNNLNTNIILDSSFATINDFSVNGINNLLEFNNDYVHIIYNNNY